MGHFLQFITFVMRAVKLVIGIAWNVDWRRVGWLFVE